MTICWRKNLVVLNYWKSSYFKNAYSAYKKLIRQDSMNGEFCFIKANAAMGFMKYESKSGFEKAILLG